MSILDNVRILVYRVHEAGLEVMLVKPKLSEDSSVWRIPQGMRAEGKPGDESIIKLDSFQESDGSKVHVYAIEEEQQEVPSVRGIIKHDVRRVKNKILKILPEMEEACFFKVKEAFKEVLPNEYAALKELRDVIQDRNSVKYM